MLSLNMKKKDLIKKILELGKELEKANGFDAVMIINDMEIEVDDYTKQLHIHSVGCSSDGCYECGSNNLRPKEYNCLDCGHDGYCY